MAPSTYASDFLNSVPIKGSEAYAVPERARGKATSKVNNRVEVLPGQKTKTATLSRGNLARAIFCLLLIGAMLIGTVWMNARATNIKYSLNQMTKENAVLEDEITMLRIKVARANSIESVEEYATETLGMVYPKTTQTVFISQSDLEYAEIAQEIKEKAYNK